MVELQFVTIPSGWFRMGSDDGQPDERPVHRVWVDAFAIAVHPVTNLEYACFVEATGHREPGGWGDARFEREDQPVVAVSWFDAIAFSAWLSREAAMRCRLPTEAEREKAARGGVDGVRYPWGDDPPARARSAAQASRPDPVGCDVANGYGLHNMGDLVHEWCSDWYRPDYYCSSPMHDPQGPSDGVRRASRGGSWRHRTPVTRCAARSSVPPDTRYTDYGFRIVVDAPGRNGTATRGPR